MARKRKQIKAFTVVKRGSHMPTGKGWRLARPPKRTAGFKASLLKTFRSGGQQFAIFRIV